MWRKVPGGRSAGGTVEGAGVRRGPATQTCFGGPGTGGGWVGGAGPVHEDLLGDPGDGGGQVDGAGRGALGPEGGGGEVVRAVHHHAGPQGLEGKGAPRRPRGRHAD